MLIVLSPAGNVYVNTHQRKSYHKDCQWLGTVNDGEGWGALMLSPTGRYHKCVGSNNRAPLDTGEVLAAMETAYVPKEWQPSRKSEPKSPGRPPIYAKERMRVISVNLPQAMIDAARIEGGGSVGKGLRKIINSGLEALGHNVPD